MLKKVFNYIKNNELKWGYIVAFGLCLVMALIYVYADLKSLTIWSTNMLDVTYDLNIRSYFEYTALNIYNVPHQYVSGSIFYMIPWAVWNIPIWILQRFFSISIVTSPLSLVWSKLFLVSCLVLTLYFAYKIVKDLTHDSKKANWVVFLSLSFFYTFVGIFYAGQTDIMICLFGTLSVYYLIKKKNIPFLVCSMIAISIKWFFLFPYIALILLTEKDILKVIKKIFLGILPVLVFAVICHFLPMYNVSMDANPFNTMISGLVNGTISLFNEGKLSLFILSLFIIYFAAYFTKIKDKVEENKFVIYFVTVTFLAMFMFTTYEFYRVILLMPFLFILISLDDKKWKLNILLEFIMLVSSVFVMLNHNAWNFFSSTGSLDGGVFASIFNVGNNIFSVHMVSYVIPFYSVLVNVFATVFIACSLALIIINHPKLSNKISLIEPKINIKFLIYLRLLFILPFILFTILTAFI